MPIYNNALTQRPANRLAYQESIGPMPRNEYLGALADFLAQSYSPERTQQMQGAAQFLSVPAISQTLDRLSYGEPLTTGAGGLGGTTRIRPEALEAAIAVAPTAKPVTMATLEAARQARRAALAGERYAERVIPQMMERGGLPAQLAMDMSRRTVSPLDVYHGTPHTLPPTARNPLGEFDASKIGTGEGAQSFGYGIYTAENPAVAAGYRDKLQKVTYSGNEIDPANPSHVALATVEQFGDRQKASAYLKQRANLMDYEVNMQAAKLLDDGSTLPTRAATGNLYKIDLPDEKIASMLDWDKPMAEQRNLIEKMRKALIGEGSPLSNAQQFELNDFLSDRVRMRNLSPQSIVDLNNPKIVKRLSEAGIPGVKYLDQGSRQPGVSSMTQAQLDTRIDILKKDIDSGLGNQDRMKQILSALEAERASHSKLTRNFVVFPGEEKNMTILERNGQTVNALAKNKTR